MGLDVHVYKNIKITEHRDDFDFVAFVPYDGWLYKIKNLENGGYYTGDITDESISYGYSTHSLFRVTLIQLIGRTDLLKPDGTINWDELLNNVDMPFYEFIDFSDCEGCLDWEISEKISNDFNKYKDVANEFYPKNSYDGFGRKSYERWMNIFNSAKDNKGVVVFR